MNSFDGRGDVVLSPLLVARLREVLDREVHVHVRLVAGHHHRAEHLPLPHSRLSGGDAQTEDVPLVLATLGILLGVIRSGRLHETELGDLLKMADVEERELEDEILRDSSEVARPVDLLHPTLDAPRDVIFRERQLVRQSERHDELANGKVLYVAIVTAEKIELLV